ncbi:hypothetical protein [Rhodococcus sp. KRD162]|uniref:hypothetical protein n=1 Tax=Rhodococcus sp. KRD162 TaxID=2729725 RepID=UPI0019D15E93|nr:hypothetical protein [Rhodococcus sp. KRD162]
MTTRGKIWVVVGIAVLILAGVVYWGVSRENEKADTQESVVTSSCVQDLGRKLNGITSSTPLDVIDIAYDRTTTVTTGTFRNPLESGNPEYTFECNKLSHTADFERVDPGN